MDRPSVCDLERDDGGRERLRVHVNVVRFGPQDVEREIDFNTARRNAPGEPQFLTLSQAGEAGIEQLFEESGLVSDEAWLTAEPA